MQTEITPHISDPREHSKAVSKLTILGLAFTALYFLALGTYIFDRSTNLFELSPNEVGDFLAGAFSPVAFIWLVIGFFQQGIELRDNGKALWLQGRELKKSVEHQEQLVQVTRDQLAHEREARLAAERDAERAAQPIILLRATNTAKSGLWRKFGFTLINVGATCNDLRIHYGNQLTRLSALKAHEEHKIFVEFEHHDDIHDMLVKINYVDMRGNSRLKEFQLVRSDPSPDAYLIPLDDVTSVSTP